MQRAATGNFEACVVGYIGHGSMGGQRIVDQYTKRFHVILIYKIIFKIYRYNGLLVCYLFLILQITQQLKELRKVMKTFPYLIYYDS